MSFSCEGCLYYQLCKSTACIAGKRYVIGEVVTVNVTEHQMLEHSVRVLNVNTLRCSFPSDVKAIV